MFLGGVVLRLKHFFNIKTHCFRCVGSYEVLAIVFTNVKTWVMVLEAKLVKV